MTSPGEGSGLRVGGAAQRARSRGLGEPASPLHRRRYGDRAREIRCRTRRIRSRAPARIDPRGREAPQSERSNARRERTRRTTRVAPTRAGAGRPSRDARNRRERRSRGSRATVSGPQGTDIDRERRSDSRGRRATRLRPRGSRRRPRAALRSRSRRLPSTTRVRRSRFRLRSPCAPSGAERPAAARSRERTLRPAPSPGYG